MTKSEFIGENVSRETFVEQAEPEEEEQRLDESLRDLLKLLDREEKGE